MNTLKVVTSTVDAKEVQEVEITTTRRIPLEGYRNQLETQKTELETQLAKVNEELDSLK